MKCENEGEMNELATLSLCSSTTRISREHGTGQAVDYSLHDTLVLASHLRVVNMLLPRQSRQPVGM